MYLLPRSIRVTVFNWLQWKLGNHKELNSILEPIEGLMKNIDILQSEIKILEVKAMFETNNFLAAKQIEHIINQSKKIH